MTTLQDLRFWEPYKFRGFENVTNLDVLGTLQIQMFWEPYKFRCSGNPTNLDVLRTLQTLKFWEPYKFIFGNPRNFEETLINFQTSLMNSSHHLLLLFEQIKLTSNCVQNYKKSDPNVREHKCCKCSAMILCPFKRWLLPSAH